MTRLPGFLILLAVLFAAVTTSVSFAGDFPAPEGWRPYAAGEVEDEWRDFSPTRYLEVKGDFDGNGAADGAKLFVRPDGSEVGLFVFMCEKDGACKEHLLAGLKGPRVLRRAGVDLVHRGRYSTACGKAYRECKEGETPEIEIRNDSIDLFESTGGNSYFYWDEAKKAFERVWMSD